MSSKVTRPVSVPPHRRPRLSVAPFEGFDRSAVIGLPQEIIDDQLTGLTEGELKVLLAMIRVTNGGQREQVPLTVRALCHGGIPDVLPGRGTGLSQRTVQTAYTKLENAGYLRVLRRSASDGSGLPSLFTLPLLMPTLSGASAGAGARFPGYAVGRRVRLPLLVTDRLLAELSGAELKVLLYILRHTFCVGLTDEVMAMARLVENTGLSLRHTRLAVASLTSRGYILVQHRQDAERGKMPSRFGVRVIGEAEPFTGAANTPVAPRVHRKEEPQEPPRPVWIVPEPAPNTAQAGTGVSGLQVVVEQEQQVVQRGQPQGAVRRTSPVADSVQASVRTLPGGGASEAAATPIRVARQSVPPQGPRSRSIPDELLQDASPVWSAAKRILANRLPESVFMPWIASIISISAGGPDLLLAVRDEHHRWVIESKLHGKIQEALDEAGYAHMRIRYLNYPGNVPQPKE